MTISVRTTIKLLVDVGGGPAAARRHRRCTVVTSGVASALVVLGWCVPDAVRGQAPVVRWERTTVEVDGREYPQYAARIGRIAVPENRAAPSGEIEVAFIHIRSPHPRPAPPLFVLGAGPGGSGIREAQNVIEELPGLIDERDIVGMDQRGTGRSRPNLMRAFTAAYPGPSERASLLRAYRELVDRARKYWDAQGVDLAGYNTWEAAADLDRIRLALGYDRIALFGFSYGSHLGLAALRRIGPQVERAAFMAIEGPNHTFKLPAQTQAGLEAVDRLVRADPRLRAVIPDFTALVQRVLNRLADSDAVVSLPDSAGPRTVTITRFDAQEFAADRVGRRRAIAALPAAFHRMAAGDFSDVAGPVWRFRRTLRASALAAVTDCASGATPDRLHAIITQRDSTLLGDLVDFPFPHLCDVWGVPPLDPSFREPIRSDVPVLLVAGALDSRTPVANAYEVAAGMPNSHVLIVENVGHDVYPGAQVAEFLRTGRAPAARIISGTPIRFDPVTPTPRPR